MTYTVVWRPAAEEKLAAIWTEADDRRAITNAANSIDSMLRLNPLDVGESRLESIRILTVVPLSIYYDVHHDDRLVAIWAIWQPSVR
jgi:plasmid stabilization system protein ParE